MADNVTSKLNVPPAPHRRITSIKDAPEDPPLSGSYIIAEVDSKGRRGKRW